MLPAILAALGEAGAAGGAAAAGAEGAGAAASGQAIGQMQQLTGKAKGLASSFTGLLSPFGALEAAGHKLYAGVNLLPSKILEVEQMITSTAHNWVATLAAPANTIKQLGDSVSSFVRLSNPSLVKQFEFRVENTFSEIGRILEPIMQSLTSAVEKVGDAYAKLKPALDPAIQAVSILIDSLMTRLEPAARLAAPAIKYVSLLLLGAAKAFETLSIPLVKILDATSRGLEHLLPGSFDEKAKGGVAIRPARYTSTEDYQRELAKNALEASIGGKPKETEVSLLDKIYTLLKQWYDRLPDVPKTPGEAIGRIPQTGLGGGAAGIGAGLWRVIS